MEKDPAPTDADSETSLDDRPPMSPRSLEHVVTRIERMRSRPTTLVRSYTQRALRVLFDPGDAGMESVPREPDFGYF